MKTIRSFEWVTPCYTGGNIYIYYGKLKNGNWFVAADSDCWLDEVDANPDDFNDEEVWQTEWIEKHSVKAYEPDEAKQFFKVMYRWILENEPENDNTNYSLYDMENRLNNIEKWFPNEY